MPKEKKEVPKTDVAGAGGMMGGGMMGGMMSGGMSGSGGQMQKMMSPDAEPVQQPQHGRRYDGRAE